MIANVWVVLVHGASDTSGSLGAIMGSTLPGELDKLELVVEAVSRGWLLCLHSTQNGSGTDCFEHRRKDLLCVGWCTTDAESEHPIHC